VHPLRQCEALRLAAYSTEPLIEKNHLKSKPIESPVRIPARRSAPALRYSFMRLFRSLVGGGEVAIFVTSPALSRILPSLRPTYSGFMKNSIFSKQDKTLKEAR